MITGRRQIRLVKWKLRLGIFFVLMAAVATVFALAVSVSDSSKDVYEPERIGDAGLGERMDAVRESFGSGSGGQRDLLSLYGDRSLRNINWHISPSIEESSVRDVKEIANLVVSEAGVYNLEGNGRVDIYLYDDIDGLFEKLVVNGVNRTAAGSLISRL